MVTHPLEPVSHVSKAQEYSKKVMALAQTGVEGPPTSGHGLLLPNSRPRCLHVPSTSKGGKPSL